VTARSGRVGGAAFIAAPPEAVRLDPILNTFRAALAGVGAYTVRLVLNAARC